MPSVVRALLGAATAVAWSTILPLVLLTNPAVSWLSGKSRSGSVLFSPIGRVDTRKACSTCLRHLAMTEYDDASESSSSSSSPSLSGRRPIRLRHAASVANLERLEQERSDARRRLDEAAKDPTLLTNVTFKVDSRPSRTNDTITETTYQYSEYVSSLVLAPTLVRAITERLHLERLTDVQAQTWPLAVAGRSILGRARTGTGKTIAYLLPSIQRILDNQAVDSELGVRIGRDIGIVVIAPTRELGQQIGIQAEALTMFQHGWTVHTLTGSTTLSRDKSTLMHKQRVPTIIVATPGRLLDLLRTEKSAATRVAGKRLLVDVVAKTPIVVLDEADLLLQAFRSEVAQILSYFPRVDKRQTMLFSATVPLKLKRLLCSNDGKFILPAEYEFVDCVGDNFAQQANQRVEQSFVQLQDMTSYLKGIFVLILEAIQDDTCHKVIIFFPTAKLVKFVSEAIALIMPKSNARSYQVLSIHSRMSHGARHRASSQFYLADDSQCSFLLTSDVSARGVDYGDVSLVVQYGAPSNDELYLHRLGRTGRAGQQGRGLLVFLPFESRFLSRRYHIPEAASSFTAINQPCTVVEAQVLALQQTVASGHAVLAPLAESACQSFAAHYLEYSSARDAVNSSYLIGAAEELASSFGLSTFSVSKETR